MQYAYIYSVWYRLVEQGMSEERKDLQTELMPKVKVIIVVTVACLIKRSISYYYYYSSY